MNLENPLFSEEESDYIKSCSLLLKNSRLDFEIKHFHSDLLLSSPDYRYLSEDCLTHIISMQPEVDFDKKEALSLLEKYPSHPPSMHLRGFLNEFDSNYKIAQDFYEQNIEYAPSSLRLATLYYENRIQIDNFTEKEALILNLINESLSKGFIHAHNLYGCLYDNQYGQMKNLGKNESKLKAYEEFEKASNSKCACAMYNIARMSADGEGPFEKMSIHERNLKSKEFYERAAFEHYNYRAISTLLDVSSAGSSFTAEWNERKRLIYIKDLYKFSKERGVSYDLRKDIKKKIDIIDKGGILYQDIFNSIFCNGLFAEKYGLNYIEDDDYLIYSENGFNVEFLGAFLQGKDKKFSEIGSEGIFLEFKPLETLETKDLPQDYCNKRLKMAEINMDFSKFTKNSDDSKVLNYYIIAKDEPIRED